MAFDYHMRADLVTDTIQSMTFEAPECIWHSDQGKQFGAEQTPRLLLQKGFALSMSRAGTPTDNGAMPSGLLAPLSWLLQIAIGITVLVLSCKQHKPGSIFTISTVLMRG